MVPQFLDRKLNVTIPPGLETVILIFIFSAEILGESRWTVRNRIIRGELIGWRPTAASRNYRLWRRQVMEIAARQQAKAIRRAHIMTSQMVLDI